MKKKNLEPALESKDQIAIEKSIELEAFALDRLGDLVTYSGTKNFSVEEHVQTGRVVFDADVSGELSISRNIKTGRIVDQAPSYPSKDAAEEALETQFREEILPLDWGTGFLTGEGDVVEDLVCCETYDCQCSTCKGHGVCACGTCGGAGKTPCRGDNPWTPCDHGMARCHGQDCNMGYNSCTQCRGSGSVSVWWGNGYKSETCPSCDGSRRGKSCSTCLGRGRVTCRACRGTERIDCRDCGASGNVGCGTCRTSGRVTRELNMDFTISDEGFATSESSFFAYVRDVAGIDRQFEEAKMHGLHVSQEEGAETASYKYQQALYALLLCYDLPEEDRVIVAHKDFAKEDTPHLCKALRAHALEDLEARDLEKMRSYPLGGAMIQTLRDGELPSAREFQSLDYDGALKASLDVVRSEVSEKVEGGEKSLRAFGYAATAFITLLFGTIYGADLLDATGLSHVYDLAYGRALFPDLRLLLLIVMPLICGPLITHRIKRRRFARARNIFGSAHYEGVAMKPLHLFGATTLQAFLIATLALSGTPKAVGCKRFDPQKESVNCVKDAFSIAVGPLIASGEQLVPYRDDFFPVATSEEVTTGRKKPVRRGAQ